MLPEHINIAVMSLVRSMNEGGRWETKFAEKKTRLLCTLKQQDDYSGTAPLPLRNMHSRFRMPRDAQARAYVPAWSHAACPTRVQ